MADNDSIKWSIEQIIDCNGNDITTGGWVSITPMEGVGDAHASISVTPSENYNDCQTATITILTGTGEKKYVTINRCNPECNCDSVIFNPLTVDTISENGGTVPVATYAMKYGCSDAYIDIVNKEAACRYQFSNGTVYAVVDKNESTTSSRDFAYYITYNGDNCGKGGSFSQKRSESKCEKDIDCSVIDVTNAGSNQMSWNETSITFRIAGVSECWTLKDIGEYSGYNFKYTITGDEVMITVDVNDDYNSEKKYKFTFIFENSYTEIPVTCNVDTDEIIQGVKPYVQTCESCADIQIQKIYPQKVYEEFGSEGTNGENQRFGEFSTACYPSGGFNVIRTSSYGTNFVSNVKLVPSTTTNTHFVLTGVVAKNTSESSRKEVYQIQLKNGEICSTLFGIEQEGAQPEPETCECEITGASLSKSVDNGKAEIRIYNLVDNGKCDDYAASHGLSAKVNYLYSGDYTGNKTAYLPYSSLKTSAGKAFVVMEEGFAQGKSITGTLTIELAGCPNSKITFENVVISRGEIRNTTVKIRLGRADASCNSNCQCTGQTIQFKTMITSDVSFIEDIKFVPYEIYFGSCNGTEVKISNASAHRATLGAGQTSAVANGTGGVFIGTSGHPAMYPNSGHGRAGGDFTFSQSENYMPTMLTGTDGVIYNITYDIKADFTKNVNDIA